MSEREKKDGGCIDSWRDCCTNAIISFPAAERLDAGPKYLTRSNFLPHLHVFICIELVSNRPNSSLFLSSIEPY